jgi:hypothetical protein
MYNIDFTEYDRTFSKNVVTDFPLGKLRSKITLLSGESLFVTVLSGDILSSLTNGLFLNGPIIAPYDAVIQRSRLETVLWK